MHLARTLTAVAALALLPGAALAQEHRELGAHVHGTATLDVAVEGTTVSMILEAPGADIVGFEHPATSDDDRAAIEAATTTLGDPLALFAPPEAAGCTASSAEVHLVAEGDHADEDHHEAGEGHDDHAEADHEAGHDEHAEAHEEGEHAEADADHDAPRHTEFRASYTLACTNPAALTAMSFPYFEAFPNAQEVDVNVIDDRGARAFEVERGNPALDLTSGA